MCGICGFVSLNGEKLEEKLLIHMNASLHHRGPDDGDIYFYRGDELTVGLGHRRLSIIDLSPAGRQPMKNENGKIRLVVNGEIYNFKELRTELEKKGHRFSSHSDSEVIIHQYEEMGTSCVATLRGMFSFALWDEKEELLLLARDPVGIKPLIYFWDGTRMVFASELKSILQDRSIPRIIDKEALDLFLTLNYIPAPFTIITGCRKLNPGHLLILHRGQIREMRYWHPERKVKSTATDEEGIKEELRQLLSQAVREQMVADVPLGAFLSGGIDSSIVCALMAINSARPIKTFTVGYSDMPLFDETAYARAVSNRFQTDHHEIILTSRDMLDVVPEVLSSLDEPFGDSSVIPTYVVSRETRKEVKVALSGDGGDELFAGYRMYRAEEWYRTYGIIPRILRRRVIEPLVNFLPSSRESILGDYLRRVKKFTYGYALYRWQRFLRLNEIFPPSLRKEILLHPYPVPSAESIFRPLLEPEAEDYLNQLLLADFLISLPGDMLWKVDKMSMANSLEVRVPLLDHRFCEYAFSLPGHLKLCRGKAKYIFIEAFKNLLPQELHAKNKWGFEVPISKWLKTSMKNLIEDYLSPARISRQDIFKAEAVDSLVHQFLVGGEERGWQIWSLIVFQVWYEKFIGS
ncbi:MAG: asparagine synthase (glutamine-hydrolyzing) [Syntrophales bacterium]|nr:asparagine synthase (glutamine-hydrolyzing) [Syntrophales bacterium]